VAKGIRTELIKGRPIFFTDGTASGAPGEAAWGWLKGHVQAEKDQFFSITHGHGEYVPSGTVGRMEAMAVKDCLDAFYGQRLQLQAYYAECGELMPPEVMMRPLIFADSEYLVKTLEPGGYIDRWEVNGYTKANSDPVANVDVMKHLSRLRKLCPFEIVHVYSHLKLNKPADIQMLAHRLGLEDPKVVGEIIYWNNIVDGCIADTRKGRNTYEWPAKFLMRR
jgi:ribonuclease HI